MGLFGYAIPEEWGGLGLDLAQDVELAMEFGYTTLAFRSMFGTNNGIAGQVLVGFGTDEQKKRWLPRIASGEVVASFALTEPGAGSNPAALRTRARRVGSGDDRVDRRRAEAVHHQRSRSPTCSSSSPAPRSRRPAGPGISVLLVPADTAGVTVGTEGRQDGPGGRLDRRRLLRRRARARRRARRRRGLGYRAAMTSLARGRIHIAALAVGSAQRALDESVAYAAGTPRAASRSATSSSCRR